MEKQENHYHGIVNQTIQGAGVQTHFVPEPMPHAVYGAAEERGLLHLMEVVGYLVGVKYAKNGKEESVSYPVCRMTCFDEPDFRFRMDVRGLPDDSFSNEEYIGRMGQEYDLKKVAELVRLSEEYGDQDATPQFVVKLLKSEFNMTLKKPDRQEMKKPIEIYCYFDDRKDVPYMSTSICPVYYNIDLRDKCYPPCQLARQMMRWNDLLMERLTYQTDTNSEKKKSEMEKLWALADRVYDHIATYGENSFIECAAMVCRRIGNAKCFYDELDLAVQKEHCGNTKEFIEGCKKEGLLEVVGNIFKFSELVETLANYRWTSTK